MDHRDRHHHLSWMILPATFVLIIFLPFQAFADWGIQTLASGYGTASGRHCSMALDAANRAHLTYTRFDDGTGYDALRYITNQIGTADTWDSVAIDAPSAMSTGAYNSIFVDPSNHVHVAYYNIGGGDLKYADSSAWPTWNSVSVDTSGDVGRDTDIVVDAFGGIHISYYDAGNQALKYAYKPAGGSWATETVFDFTCANPDDPTCWVGQYSSIGIDTAGNPHIVYYENAYGHLKHAVKSSGTWSSETVSTIWAEHETSLAMDGDDLHVSFYNAVAGNLMYATNATGNWVVETAHNSSFDVGTYSSIGLDATGNVHIAYYDETEQDLEYTNNASGFWMNQTVDDAGIVGSEKELVVGGADQVHIGYYGPTDNSLKYAVLDPDAPSINASVPQNQTQTAPPNRAVLAAFSEAIDPTTMTSSSFYLLDEQNNSVSGTVAYDATSRIAVFYPGAALIPETTYTATVTTDVTDLGGKPMARNVSFSFTTALSGDSDQPYVESSIPANGAGSVATNSAVMILFSEEIDPTTLTTTALLLHGEDVSGGGAYNDAVSGTIAYDAGKRIALFTPDAPLSESRNYQVTLTSAIDDLCGAGMTSDHSFIFTTGNSTDTIAVSVTSVTPTEGAVGVLQDAVATIQFSEPVNPLTLISDHFSVSESTARSITYNLYNHTATLTFDTALVSSKLYTATAIAGIEDLAGNALNPGKQWTFTATPGVQSTWPVNRATNVDPDLDREIEAIFYGDMDASTIDSSSFFLSRNGTTVPGSTVTYDVAARTAKLRIPDTLTLYSGATYTVTLTTAVQDQHGAGLEQDYTWEFTTFGSPSDGGSGGCFLSDLLAP